MKDILPSFYEKKYHNNSKIKVLKPFKTCPASINKVAETRDNNLSNYSTNEGISRWDILSIFVKYRITTYLLDIGKNLMRKMRW